MNKPSEKYLTLSVENNPDGSCKKKKLVYAYPLSNGSIAEIINYDNKGRYDYVEYYNDTQFSDLNYTIKYTYYKNGSYRVDWYYEQRPYIKDIYSVSEKFDEKDRRLYSKRYSDKKMKKLKMTSEIERFSNGCYKYKYTYTSPCNQHGDMVIIDRFDKKKRYTVCEYFSDKECKKLRVTRIHKYNSDGTFFVLHIYKEKINDRGEIAVIYKQDKDNKILSKCFFKDKRCKEFSRFV